MTNITLKAIGDKADAAGKRALCLLFARDNIREAEERLADPEDAYALSPIIARMTDDLRAAEAEQAAAEALYGQGRELGDALAREHVDALLADPSRPAIASGALREVAPYLDGFDVGAFPSLSVEEVAFIEAVLGAVNTCDEAARAERSLGELLAIRSEAAA